MSEHCEACKNSGGRENGCPGVTCPACQEKEAEIRILDKLNKDECERDTEIRNLVRPILGEQKTDGDTYGVPGTVDIVESLVSEIARLLALVAVGREMYRILNRHDLGESMRVTPLLESWRSLEGKG